MAKEIEKGTESATPIIGERNEEAIKEKLKNFLTKLTALLKEESLTLVAVPRINENGIIVADVRVMEAPAEAPKQEEAKS